MIVINNQLSIPEHELSYTTSRSSGPGGQHVNKVSSRITLLFNVDASPNLSESQKRLMRSRLATRINQKGVLRVVSQKYRSQTANQEAARERFAELVRQALCRQPSRRPTSVPATAKQQRLDDKKRQSQRKRDRARRSDWSD